MLAPPHQPTRPSMITIFRWSTCMSSMAMAPRICWATERKRAVRDHDLCVVVDVRVLHPYAGRGHHLAQRFDVGRVVVDVRIVLHHLLLAVEKGSPMAVFSMLSSTRNRPQRAPSLPARPRSRARSDRERTRRFDT